MINISRIIRQNCMDSITSNMNVAVIMNTNASWITFPLKIANMESITAPPTYSSIDHVCYQQKRS